MTSNKRHNKKISKKNKYSSKENEANRIKKYILTDDDKKDIIDFLKSIRNKNYERPFLKLRINKNGIFKKGNKSPLKYKPALNIIKMLVMLIKEKKVNEKTFSNSITVQKVLYHNDSVIEQPDDITKVITVPIFNCISSNNIERICGTLKGVKTYLIEFDFFSKDDQFIENLNNYKKVYLQNKEILVENNEENIRNNEPIDHINKKVDTKLYNINYTSEDKMGELSLKINTKVRNINNHVIFTIILFGNKNHGIILEFFTTSEYKDYIQRTNKDTRFFSWYINDPCSFIRNFITLINDNLNFNSNFDFSLNYRVFSINSSIKRKISNNELHLIELYNIFLSSEEDSYTSDNILEQGQPSISYSLNPPQESNLPNNNNFDSFFLNTIMNEETTNSPDSTTITSQFLNENSINNSLDSDLFNKIQNNAQESDIDFSMTNSSNTPENNTNILMNQHMMNNRNLNNQEYNNMSSLLSTQYNSPLLNMDNQQELSKDFQSIISNNIAMPAENTNISLNQLYCNFLKCNLLPNNNSQPLLENFYSQNTSITDYQNNQNYLQQASSSQPLASSQAHYYSSIFNYSSNESIDKIDKILNEANKEKLIKICEEIIREIDDKKLIHICKILLKQFADSSIMDLIEKY
ncbi:hypothetical protein BCR36DRAFT_411939 [Piromyces finnis]|uniref:Uncharacterized protein n=1 Tax=Piromyces finnis TaxID=1754191 RepID=A0A1Y1VB48_9FUNG|nr:hypothetical protein BCR36DRAFT_411939 [Piromyces finnis]|eukprot:ORX51477.1 hypothetical protein BCR36DRAFT_411939 [Piromyces finnis]